jgi:hypothetical protein
MIRGRSVAEGCESSSHARAAIDVEARMRTQPTAPRQNRGTLDRPGLRSRGRVSEASRPGAHATAGRSGGLLDFRGPPAPRNAHRSVTTTTLRCYGVSE